MNEKIMQQALITATGLFTPQQAISNAELVEAFNTWVANYNAANANMIASGKLTAKQASSAEFIEKASGIKSRYVLDKQGVLDPKRMKPYFAERPNEEVSLQAEIAIAAAKQALANANLTGQEIDLVIQASSNSQRAYPAVAIEVQQAIGATGFAYDMNVACSSATFGIQAGVNAVQTGQATRVLVVNPEICSAHLNFTDRDSHFIFGDACTAIIIENAALAENKSGFEVVSSKLITQFSNNIRNNAGFLNRCDESGLDKEDKLFVQEGRRVFKEVCPLVAKLISSELEKNSIQADEIKRFWLHQANLSMNQLITKRVLGRSASAEEAPVILDTYANTSSAGSIIAFHLHQDNLNSGDLGIICSFGAGYSAGCLLVKKVG